CVDMPVANLQGGAHGVNRVPQPDEEDTEAELRNRMAVVEHDVGYWTHHCGTPQGGQSASRDHGPDRSARDERVHSWPSCPLPDRTCAAETNPGRRPAPVRYLQA